jgi:hypothetical protein
MKRVILAVTFLAFAFSAYAYRVKDGEKEEAERQRKAAAAAQMQAEQEATVGAAKAKAEQSSKSSRSPNANNRKSSVKTPASNTAEAAKDDPNFLPDGVYKFQGKGGYYISSGNNRFKDEQANMYTWSETPDLTVDQRFYLQRNPEGFYYVYTCKEDIDGKYFNYVWDEKTDNDHQLTKNPYHGAEWQQFKFVKKGNFYQIRGRYSNGCVDVFENKSENVNNTPLNLIDCKEDQRKHISAQRFMIMEAVNKPCHYELNVNGFK